MPRPLGWLRARMGVRAVSALSAAVVVALALLVGGASLVLLVQQSLKQQVRSEAVQQAELIVSRLAGDFESDSNENAREAIRALTQESADLAQVIVEYGANSDDTPTYTIEAGTDPVGRDPDGRRMSDLWPDVGETIVEPNVPVRTVDGEVVDTVLVAAGTESAERHVVLLYAARLTAVDQATATLLFYLLWGVPLLILVAGITTYLFAGRALRPVEAMRVQVAATTEKDLGHRVTVPPARDEVGRLAETMNAMLARLQDAQGVQRRFVADASHELRSPLATIATGLELMQNGSADRSTVTALRGETSRLNKLVEGLILLARADERGLQPRREEVDLDEVAELERGRPADGAVAAEVRAVPVRVIGDRGQLARVVRNLVDNARRHARSRVLVTVGRDGDTAVLEVSDDGPGVPPADRARVFERFVRLDDARARADGGSGLGLAIVAEVVAAHGGTVEVTDAPGGGALFRVRMPAAADPAVPAEDAAPAAAQGASRPNAEAGEPAGAAPPVAAVPLPKRTSSGAARRGRAARPAHDSWPGEAAWTGEAVWAGDPGHREPEGPTRNGGELFREPARGLKPAPRPAAPQPVPPPVPQPRDTRSGTASTPAAVRADRRPVRDEEARRDPDTAPGGIPVVASDEPKSERPRRPVRPQPGSAMR
jgi:signal transduction histidine kinase